MLFSCGYKKRIRLPLQLVVFLLLITATADAQLFSVIRNADKPVSIGGRTEILIDSTGVMPAADVMASTKFGYSTDDIPVFPVVDGVVWLRFAIVNQTPDSVLYLDLQYPNISSFSIYKQQGNGLQVLKSGGNSIDFDANNQPGPNYVCRISLPTGDSATYYLKVTSVHPVLLPLFVSNRLALDGSLSLQDIVIGVYMGIMMAIFLYNLFLFFSTRDKSYFIYVLYLLILAFAQVTVSGYGFKYFWPGLPSFNAFALPVSSAMAGISGILFAMFFLQTKENTPRLNGILYLLIALFVGSAVLSVAGLNSISYIILNLVSLLGGLILLSASMFIARTKQYKPAYFYFAAWVAFLGGMIIFVLRNFNVLPYNNFTTYILYVGSAIEGIVLSIALADKINSLRAEKEKSQAEALRVSQENERLVRDQNIVLEKKVAERTEELQQSNTQLSTTLQDLKEAQSQLVEAEKMDSLGQLTAGIAHEINNPINFVKSNIKPLQLDIRDLLEVIDEYDKLHAAEGEKVQEQLKQVARLKKDIDLDYVKSEIESLMKGIQDGAERTAEIVLGLRNFSRLDESDIKTVDIHEGLDSTLVLLKNQMPDNVRVVRDYKANGTIECLPGKLNQVFMNIMSNALQAIKGKEEQGDEALFISTRDEGDRIVISIKDTGPGMTEEVKHKIFDPFFTTKDVGEGTGLGLSIVFKIIQRHEGKIEVVTSPGNGAEFIITLFHTLPESAVT